MAVSLPERGQRAHQYTSDQTKQQQHTEVQMQKIYQIQSVQL